MSLAFTVLPPFFNSTWQAAQYSGPLKEAAARMLYPQPLSSRNSIYTPLVRVNLFRQIRGGGKRSIVVIPSIVG